MLRGAIDLNDGWRIGGWIYSPEVAVRDRLLLAFVDAECVGSGPVDRFRQDLADAGLGDGFCGFEFPITLSRIEDRPRVFVKLDWSDFALLPQGGRIIDGQAPIIAAHAYPADSLDWMHARGWIDAADMAALSDLSDKGIHALMQTEAPADAAKRLLELYRRGPVRLQGSAIRLSNLATERERLIDGATLPIIALRAPAGSVSLGGVTRHPCTEDLLLFVDLRLPVSGEGDETALLYRAA